MNNYDKIIAVAVAIMSNASFDFNFNTGYLALDVFAGILGRVILSIYVFKGFLYLVEKVRTARDYDY